MEEEEDFKPSLKPTQMEVPQPKPTLVVSYELWPTEKKKNNKKKKKKKKLKKDCPSSYGTTFQPKTQDDIGVHVGLVNTFILALAMLTECFLYFVGRSTSWQGSQTTFFF